MYRAQVLHVLQEQRGRLLGVYNVQHAVKQIAPFPITEAPPVPCDAERLAREPCTEYVKVREATVGKRADVAVRGNAFASSLVER